MFVRMMVVYCDQNYTYEMAMNGYQKEKETK